MGADRGARGRGQDGAGAWPGRHTGARPLRRVSRRARPGGGTSATKGGRGGRDRGRRAGAQPGEARGRQGRGQGGCAGKKKGRGRGRKREGEGRGAHLGDPNSGDHRLQDLGHHEERERGGREVAAREKSNERKRPGEGGTRMGRARAPGARGPRPGRAGSGWAGLHSGSKPYSTHNHRSENQFAKQKSKRN
jgi:hypothetical protein